MYPTFTTGPSGADLSTVRMATSRSCQVSTIKVLPAAGALWSLAIASTSIGALACARVQRQGRARGASRWRLCDALKVLLDKACELAAGTLPPPSSLLTTAYLRTPYR